MTGAGFLRGPSAEQEQPFTSSRIGYEGYEGYDQHEDVSRTISDTLGAEFSEYVTRCKTTPFGKQQYHVLQPPQQPQYSPHQALGLGLTLDQLTADSNYTSRVEFGLKLGYTESQVQVALIKLGPRAGQNELLAELIKLGATSSPPSSPCKAPANYGSSGDASDATDESAFPDYLSVCDDGANLRPIVVDGSNVAMSHGNKEVFSCMGIKVCVDWFKSRGHREVTVFVPMWRKEASRPDAPIKDQDILVELEAERLLVFTPSRNVGRRRMACYDDRYILKLASENDGIVVSNDNYRDLVNENPEYKKVVEERLLMYSFVNDRFMPPDDPLGRKGPSLDNFLRKRPKPPETLPPPCPYGKKCTYGNKCKYYHPERGNQPQKSVTERLVEQAKIQLQEVKARASNAAKSRESSPGEKLKATHTGSLPPSLHGNGPKSMKMALSRTRSVIPAQSRDTSSDSSPSLSFDGSSWALKNQPLSPIGHQLPQFTSSSCADLFCNSSQACDHLYVAKRLSDPDHVPSGGGRRVGSMVSPKAYHSGDNSPVEVESGNNLHRKLQRQLTLNPTYDARLLQMPGYQERLNQQPFEQPPGHCLQQQPIGSHRQVQRLGSEGGHVLQQQQQQQQRQQQQQQHFLSPYTGNHHNVTRIASAPDPHSYWLPHPSQAQIARLNSTSDSRLHLTPSPPPHALGLSTSHPLPPFPGQNIWSSNAVSGHFVSQSQNSWGHQSVSAVRPSSVPPQAINCGPRSSVPVAPQPTLPSSSATFSSLPNAVSNDSRYKLYFHLSSIFPEEQVRAAIELYPEETNAQKICAAILAMFPKG